MTMTIGELRRMIAYYPDEQLVDLIVSDANDNWDGKDVCLNETPMGDGTIVELVVTLPEEFEIRNMEWK